MNILFVVHTDAKRGGVISVVDNLARHLEAEGHGVLFFHMGVLPLLKKRVTKLGFRGFQLRLPLPFGPGLRSALRTLVFPVLFPVILVQLIWLLRSRRIQIVNLHYPLEYHVYFAICRRLLPICLVTSIHGRDAFYHERPRAHYSRTFRFVVESSDLVVLPSDAYRRKLLEAFPSVSNRTIFIHNGIDPARFNAGDDTRGSSGTRKYVLCVAELQEYKGIDILLHAARPLLTDNPSLTLVLAGDGPMREELEALAASLGIRHQTMFLGAQGAAEVARLLSGCEANVLPSREEPFGIAIIEAMACKAPVVASDVGGVPEIIQHEKNGILVEPENVEALTAALRRVLSDGDLRKTIAENAYSTVMQRFCSRHTGEAYLSAFTSLLTPGSWTSSALPRSAASSRSGDAQSAS